MKHIDDETLALVALGVTDLSADDDGHLAECEVCAHELDALGRTVALGKVSQGVALEQPSPAVWGRIQAEIARSPGAAEPPAPLRPRRSARPGIERPRPAAAPSGPPRRSRSPRRLRPALWLAATAVIAVIAAVGGFIASSQFRPDTTSASSVVERARLQALPGWGGARGTATLARSSDGHLSLTIDMTPGSAKPASVAGPLREVWLMKPDLSGLMSLGYLTDGSGTFAVPDGLNVSTYDLVDISAQAANGVPSHSGQSIMRGRLTT